MASKTPITTPHDRVFRASMKNIKVARDYFLKHLPKEILDVTDLNTLELRPETYVDEQLKLAQSDVLYGVQIAGKKAYLYLLCEHQSTPDKWMPFRVMKYEVNIWADHLNQFGGDSLPLIVTTVFYNGRKPYIHSTDFRDLLNAPKELIDAVWRQPFKLIDVHAITDQEIRQHKWIGILEFFMAHIFARDFQPYLEQAMAILKELEAENGSDYVVTLLNYALTTVDIESIEGFVDVVKQKLSVNTGEKMGTLAEKLMERGEQRGIQKGIEQGIEQGEIKGKRMLLKRLLARRFGSIPTIYLDKIDNASEELLLLLSDNIMEAQRVEEIFATRH